MIKNGIDIKIQDIIPRFLSHKKFNNVVNNNVIKNCFIAIILFNLNIDNITWAIPKIMNINAGAHKDSNII